MVKREGIGGENVERRTLGKSGQIKPRFTLHKGGKGRILNLEVGGSCSFKSRPHGGGGIEGGKDVKVGGGF